jgi:hypothetical protein
VCWIVAMLMIKMGKIITSNSILNHLTKMRTKRFAPFDLRPAEFTPGGNNGMLELWNNGYWDNFLLG